MPSISISKTRDLATPDVRSAGDVAARCFADFDRGMRPDEVVAHSVLSADTVECLWRTWARLRGLVPVSPEGIRALRESVYSGLPLTTGAQVVTAVQRFAERPVRLCTRCKTGCPEYCCVCPAREAHRAARTSSTR
jgi:hypothetical protein